MNEQEPKTVHRLFFYSMFLSGSYTVLRSAGDSLFLSRLGNNSLAFVFVASGILTAMISTCWYLLTRRLSVKTVLTTSGFFFATMTAACWIAIPRMHHSQALLASIYLLTEVKGCINVINVVTAANEYLGRSSRSRSWTRIGMGAPLACLLAGALIGVEANLIDLRTWILLSAILDIVALMPIARMPVRSAVRRNRAQLHQKLLWPALQPGEAVDRFSRYARSRPFRFWLAIMIGSKIVVLTVVTYLWKVSVNEHYEGQENSLARYFGTYYAIVGVLTLVIQGFLTNRLLARGSLRIPLLTMPVSFVVFGTILVAASSTLLVFVTVTVARSFESWRRSVHDTTLSLIYTQLPRRERRGAISANVATLKPLAEVSAGLALLFGAPAIQRPIVLSAALLWLLATTILLQNMPPTRQQETDNPVPEKDPDVPA